MVAFQDLFMKSKGKPIIYNGNTIQMSDCLPVIPGQVLKIIFEGVNSDWRQGIGLKTDGSFEVNNQVIKKFIVLWRDTAPIESALKVNSKNDELLIKNVWDVGDGVMHSGHNGAAMIVDALPKGRRYRCNDGRADDDFDDLIFRIETID